VTAVVLLIVALIASYAFVAWVRADGGSMIDVVRADLLRIKTRIRGDHYLGPIGNAPELFAVEGRHQFDDPSPAGEPPRVHTRRQRGGVEIGPIPEGGGRVRNPNAPCWLCGQKKTPNHKCM